MHKTLLKQSPSLNRIGLWATIWWGVSCLYPFWLVLSARSVYIAQASAHAGGRLNDWAWAVSKTWGEHGYFAWALVAVIAVWLVTAAWWLRAVKRAGNSYAVAFRDLFLTIR